MSGSRGGVCARPPDFCRTSISEFPQKGFSFFFFNEAKFTFNPEIMLRE